MKLFKLYLQTYYNNKLLLSYFSSLSSLDFSNNNVNYMNEMIYNCSKLTSFNLSNFNINNINNMSNIIEEI